jgi:hypothetical protein
LSKENEPIERRLGDSGRDRGEGGLEISVDIVTQVLMSCGRGRKGTKGGYVVRPSDTKTRQSGESTWIDPTPLSHRVI